MAIAYTTNFNLGKPEVGARTDQWGTDWNTNADLIDAALQVFADLGDPVAIAHGGTGATSVGDARTALGLGTAARQPDTRYAHRVQNLLDLPDKPTARFNLGAHDAANLITGELPIARIADGDVTNAKLASGIDAAKLTTGTLSIARIADGDVTNAKLASGIDAAKLTTGTLPIARIADGDVTNAKLASGIDAAKLTTGTLAEARLPNSVLTQQSESKSADGDFTSGTLKFVRIGDQVTITATALLAHGSSSSVSSSSSFVPPAYRPSTTVQYVALITGTSAAGEAKINSSGTLSVDYIDVPTRNATNMSTNNLPIMFSFSV